VVAELNTGDKVPEDSARLDSNALLSSVVPVPPTPPPPPLQETKRIESNAALRKTEYILLSGRFIRVPFKDIRIWQNPCAKKIKAVECYNKLHFYAMRFFIINNMRSAALRSSLPS
jgi:hypothetical protein